MGFRYTIRRYSRITRLEGLVALSLAIILLPGADLLSLARLTQQFAREGPSVPLSERRSYWIDYYFLPPIERGQSIRVSLESSKEGRVLLYLYNHQGLFPGLNKSGEPPIVSARLDPEQRALAIDTLAPVNDQYVLVVIAYTTYAVRAESVWSPFFFLQQYRLLGIALWLGALVLLYYSRIQARREQMIIRALSS